MDATETLSQVKQGDELAITDENGVNRNREIKFIDQHGHAQFGDPLHSPSRVIDLENGTLHKTRSDGTVSASGVEIIKVEIVD